MTTRAQVQLPGFRDSAELAAHSVARQLRIVLALIIREMKIRYGRSRLGYIMAFVAPAIQKGLIVTVMLAVDRNAPLGNSAVLFYWVGLSSYHMFGFVSAKVLGSVKGARSVRQFPSVRTMDYVLCRAVLEIVTNVITSFVGFVLIYYFDSEMALPGNIYPVLESMLLMLMIGFGVGVTVGCIAVFYPSLGFIWKAMSGFLMLTSGLFRVPEFLPYSMREVLAWNPLTHGIDLFRTGFYPNFPTSFVDTQYLAYWSCAALVIGLATERILRRRIDAYR